MQTWVDFAAIKQSVPLASLLRQYQVKLRCSGVPCQPEQERLSLFCLRRRWNCARLRGGHGAV